MRHVESAVQCATLIFVAIKHILIKLHKTLVKKKVVAQSLILLSFLVTFLCIRIITHLQKAHILANQTGSLHIHHMVPGIILLLVTGFLGISFWHNEKLRHITAVFFGIGAALTIDEFALWLFLKDVYWAKQGRDSIDAIIVVIVLLILSFLFTETDFFQFLERKKI